MTNPKWPPLSGEDIQKLTRLTARCALEMFEPHADEMADKTGLLLPGVGLRHPGEAHHEVGQDNVSENMFVPIRPQKRAEGIFRGIISLFLGGR